MMWIRASLLLAALAIQPAAAQAPPGAVLLGEFRDWSAAAQQGGPAKLCFAYSQPKSSRPTNLNRDPTYLYVTVRPREAVRGEVSVKIGYPFKERSTATTAVGRQSFEMAVLNDTAWLVNPADDGKLIAAMRRGRDLVVKGTSRRGTATTDTYSLAGLREALERIAQECR